MCCTNQQFSNFRHFFIWKQKSRRNCSTRDDQSHSVLCTSMQLAGLFSFDSFDSIKTKLRKLSWCCTGNTHTSDSMFVRFLTESRETVLCVEKPTKQLWKCILRVEERRPEEAENTQHMVESHWLISNVFSFTPVCAQRANVFTCSRVCCPLPAFCNACRLMLLAHHIDTVWLRVSEHWTRNWLVAYACPLAHAVVECAEGTLSVLCSKMCILLIGFGTVDDDTLGNVRQFTELKRKTRQNELNGSLVLHKHFRDYVLFSLYSRPIHKYPISARSKEKKWKHKCLNEWKRFSVCCVSCVLLHRNCKRNVLRTRLRCMIGVGLLNIE